MKIFLTLLFALVITIGAKADAWDNLTKQEAEKVVEHLKKHPFIFDYCDCCQDEDYATQVYFLKINSTSIVTCDWDQEKFSVEFDCDIIAMLSYDQAGLIADKVFPVEEDETKPNKLFMNYTWVWNPSEKGASPVFDVIDYTTYGEDPQACKPKFKFPSPSQLAAVGVSKAYKKWYKSAMK